MFHGYSTLGAVAIRLAEDNLSGELRKTKFSFHQAVEKVCFRQESIAAMDDGPSYLWWYVDGNDEDIALDRGKMVCVPRGKLAYRPVPAVELSGVDLLDGEIRNYWYDRIGNAIIRMGLQPGQRVLSRYQESWYTDYYGESDCDVGHEILYVEPHQSKSVYLPIDISDIWDGYNPMRKMHLQ